MRIGACPCRSGEPACEARRCGGPLERCSGCWAPRCSSQAAVRPGRPARRPRPRHDPPHPLRALRRRSRPLARRPPTPPPRARHRPLLRPPRRRRRSPGPPGCRPMRVRQAGYRSPSGGMMVRPGRPSRAPRGESGRVGQETSARPESRTMPGYARGPTRTSPAGSKLMCRLWSTSIPTPISGTPGEAWATMVRGTRHPTIRWLCTSACRPRCRPREPRVPSR